MNESVLDKAKLRLQAIEQEAEDLRAFVRMYAKLAGHADHAEAPRENPTKTSVFGGSSLLGASREFSSRDEIVGAAREVLKQVHPRPLMIGDLFDALQDRGIKISGNNPKGNLSAKLSQPNDIVYVRDEGWYYQPQRDEASDTQSGTDQSEASTFQQPAEGREAAPGGGP